ncbi:hypothetical protein [Niabella hirudinis]|uniref:hypothetical protein n=1 Tax=Niabella hirudinis TaxID=1285929 RepID=UPI003EBA571D
MNTNVDFVNIRILTEALYNKGVTNGSKPKYATGMSERSPVYTERFARQGDITAAQSVSIFNELKNRGFIDDNNYFGGYSDVFLNRRKTAC